MQGVDGTFSGQPRPIPSQSLPSSSSQDHFSPDQNLSKGRKKVPESQRQRAETSCDRCKTRKRRCIRAPESTICVGCQEIDAQCLITLPRKRRSTASQSTRDALLASIVRKLYPDTDIDSVAGLSALAERLGVDDDLRAGSETGVMDGIPEEGGSVPGAGDCAEDTRMTGSRIERSDVPEGWLVPAPRGGQHYVGTSSLIYFARCAREIVGKSTMLNQPAFDEGGLRRYMKATEFTKYQVSHTIEANLEGHPATVAAFSPSATSTKPDATTPSAIRSRILDPSLANRLVSAFFDRVHPNIPILHRGAFQMRFEEARTGRSKEPGWTCTLYMVYTLGAQALEGELAEAREIQEEYLSNVIREELGRLVLTSTLSNVQALLLLSLYQHNAGERNTAWILVGQAVRAGVALGLHRDGENNNFDPFERNIRRTVWWTLHFFEQFISLALGRPSFTDAIKVNAGMPEASFVSSLGLPIDHLERQVSLSGIIVRIKQAVAVVSVHFAEPVRLRDWYPAIIAIRADLKGWKNAYPPLPIEQSYPQPQHHRQALLLLIWADYLESVLCRPYLLCRVNQDMKQGERCEQVNELAASCVAATEASVEKLLVLADLDLLEGSVWLDFYAVQHSIMLLALHVLGQPSSPSPIAIRESTSRLVSYARHTRLAPTYRITMNVALQLAFIAGIASDVRVSTRHHSPSGMGNPTEQSTSLLHLPAAMDSTQTDLEHFFGQLPPGLPEMGNTGPLNMFDAGFTAENGTLWDYLSMGDVASGALSTNW